METITSIHRVLGNGKTGGHGGYNDCLHYFILLLPYQPSALPYICPIFILHISLARLASVLDTITKIDKRLGRKSRAATHGFRTIGTKLLFKHQQKKVSYKKKRTRAFLP